MSKRSAFIVFLILAALTSFARAAVREIGPIDLTVADLDRELLFYTNTLPFRLISISESSGREADVLLGLAQVKLRIAELVLGSERVILTEHAGGKGRPIPSDSRSYDHWFQHIAIVVRDMDQAYEQLRRHKVKQVSTGPQTLPAWNQGAAGIKAYYFRDPEDHVLEIIWFPPGKGDPKWQSRSCRLKEAESQDVNEESASSRQRLHGPDSPLFLGIDHTAIVVSDTDKSLAFYRDLLGLRVAGESENYGVEQEHLNQVFGARLRIMALRAEKGPGIEFLEYITPPGGRPLAADANAGDLVFWDTYLLTDHFDELTTELRARQTRFVSKDIVHLSASSSSPVRGVIARDPDGHALQFLEMPSETAAARGPVTR